ncbi:MAG TPA: hypothetical protein VKK79_01440, partial [Candidatus Lokiarchaeia archaeon]|nr:hypothetical protein [Candidatus Lokiarchaeia archaeon]
KGLLLYFQSEAFITSLPVFETNWGDLPRTVTTALPEDTRQYLKDQSTLYPSLLRVDLPDFGKQPPKEERGGEPSNNPSEGEPKAPESPEKKPDQASLRSRLLSAVMKALIVAAEVEGGDMLVSANTKIKLLRMVYALDFLSAQKENENISPAFKAGFDFLAELPAILPDSGFAEAIGWLVSDIVNNDWVKQTSLDIPLVPASAGQPEKGGEVRNPVEFLEEQVEELENPGKPAEGGEEGENPTSKITTYLEAEENRTEGFQATRTNYSDAVELIFSVLSCYLALADSQNAAETLKTFIGSAETSWLKRVKALKAGEQLPLKADDPFKALLDGTSSNFSEDAGKILATIKGTPPSPEETETTGASIQSSSSSRVRPLPLYLSSSKVTLGKISAMNDITSRLRSGGGFDSEVYALDEDVVTTAFATYGLDSSDVDSYTAFTMTPTKECGIPFKIDLPPLGSDDLEATNQEWGALGYLVRLLPEVDFAIADPVPWNPPSDRDKWIQRYQNDQAGAQAEMDKIIDKMHRMRNYKLDLKHFLSNRKEIVLRTLKWGLSSNRGLTEILQGINLALDEALMVQLIASAKQSKTGKTRLSEIDRITKLVSDWAGASNLEEIDKSLRLDTRFPANSPDPDNKLRQSPGGRLALYFYGGDGASRAEEMEKDLGIKVKTWDDTDLDNVDFGAVEGRGTQLVGLLKAKLSHEGFKLRERRAKRDFCLRKIAYLQRGGAIDALKHPGEFGGATPTNKLTRAERRHLFRVALEYLKRQPWFVAYVCGNIFPCEVVVPPRVFSKLKESAQANVFSLLIFPPRLPSRNVHAAVGIVGPKSVVRRPPSWATLIPRSDVVPDLILSFDLNRLSCPRTGAFRLNQLAEGALLSVPLDVPLASRALDFDHNGTPPGLVDPPLDDWALLANVFDVKRGQPLVNQAPSGENLPVAANFRHKVRVGAFLPPDADYKSVTDEAIYTTCPSDDRPFDIEARKIVLTFSDEIGALFAYWGAKQTHLWRHKVTCLRKMWKIRKQAQGQAKDLDLSRWSQEPRSKWLRLASEVSSLNRRVTSLRKAIVEYFKRLLYYLVARSGADFIAYENLSFKSGKNPQGDLSRVVALMIKDPTLIFAQLRDFMKQENLPFPKLGGVSPSYTSRVCDSCARLGIESEVDRSASYDFSPCDSCTSILDDHCNSADNIGTRLGKKLIKQRTEEEKEEKPAGESEEEPSPKKGPMLNEEKPEAKKAQRPLAGE